MKKALFSMQGNQRTSLSIETSTKAKAVVFLRPRIWLMASNQGLTSLHGLLRSPFAVFFVLSSLFLEAKESGGPVVALLIILDRTGGWGSRSNGSNYRNSE